MLCWGEENKSITHGMPSRIPGVVEGGKKKMGTLQLCPYTVQRKSENKSILVNCRGCEQGGSTLFDETCRSNLFRILQKEYGVNRLVLNHALVKVFSGESLVVLKEVIQLRRLFIINQQGLFYLLNNFVSQHMKKDQAD